MRRPLALFSFAVVVLSFTLAPAVRAQRSLSGDASLQTAIAPPVLRYRADAAYPPDALRDRREGTVGLLLVVDEAGKVSEARVTAPAGHGFDDAAVAAARSFTFDPARRNGRPIRSTVQLAYEFHLPALPGSASIAQPSSTRGGRTAPALRTLVVADKPLVPIGGPPERSAASASTTDADQLSLYPRYRAEGLLDVVPGLFSVQHAGGGKAQQEFARGFNLDHGTDMAFFVDGVPINAVSHAHGQGYSDLHFLIPETVAQVDSTKGPYAADVGDFGTAGATTFRMADHTDESLAKLELAPSTGHERLVVIESPDLGERWRIAVAAEVFHENGPFVHPEHFDRYNGYAKATHALDERSDVSFLAMVYGGSWNMSGLLPARAVCGETDGTPTPAAYSGSRCIDRFDAIDSTQGGGSQRAMVSTQYRRQFDAHWDVAANVYALRSSLQIFPNDGIAAAFQPDGIPYGSQIEQDDTRTQSGASIRLTDRSIVAGLPVRTSVGLQIRNDDVDVELHRTRGRTRLDGADANVPGPIYDGHTDETETGAFVEGEIRPAPWLRFVLGARADRVDVATSNQSPTAVLKVSGSAGQGEISPKATAVVAPIDQLDLFVNYGRGFHSNDARVALLRQSTLIAAATGYEVGTTVRPAGGLAISAIGFLLDLASELTIDGDTASTSPSGSTRRYGVEVSGHYDLDKRLYADVAFTAAHGRYTDATDIASGTILLPNAPVRTFSASVGGRQPAGDFSLLGSVTVRSMSDRYGDKGPAPLVETGWTVVNAEAGVRWKKVDLAADLLNVFDARWREGQLEVSSRLPAEGPNPRPGISFTPGLPRTLMVHAAVHW